MGVRKKTIILYVKIFLLLFIIGIVFPYIINSFLNNLMNNSLSHDNSIFVMDREVRGRTFLDEFIKIFNKMFDF